jgi:NADH-quinone oxidoreductase subunit N
VLGVVMLLGGVGFKLAVVPFHMWTPDVYQGAPAPVTAYIATVSKGAMFALLLRYFSPVSLHTDSTLFYVFAAVAIASMVAGNLLALRQDNVKRILAYSSIANLGYVLVAFLASGPNAPVAVTFFLFAYFATSLVAFGVVTTLSTHEREAEWIDDYRGLARTRRWTAAAFTVALLSLAGMPLTMGFIGKFYLVTAGAGAGLWALVIVLVLTSAVSIYYYTRIIVAMWVREPDEKSVRTAVGAASGVVLAVLTVALVIFGVFPSPLLTLIERAVATLP